MLRCHTTGAVPGVIPQRDQSPEVLLKKNQTPAGRAPACHSCSVGVSFCKYFTCCCPPCPSQVRVPWRGWQEHSPGRRRRRSRLGQGGGNGTSGDVSVRLRAASPMGAMEHRDPQADLSQLIPQCPERGDGVCSCGGSWRSLILDSSPNRVFLKLFKSVLCV